MSTYTDGARPSVSPAPEEGPGDDPHRAEGAAPGEDNPWLAEEIRRRIASASGSGGRHARREAPTQPSTVSGYTPRHSVAEPGTGAPGSVDPGPVDAGPVEPAPGDPTARRPEVRREEVWSRPETVPVAARAAAPVEPPPVEADLPSSGAVAADPAPEPTGGEPGGLGLGGPSLPPRRVPQAYRGASRPARSASAAEAADVFGGPGFAEPAPRQVHPPSRPGPSTVGAPARGDGAPLPSRRPRTVADAVREAEMRGSPWATRTPRRAAAAPPRRGEVDSTAPVRPTADLPMPVPVADLVEPARAEPARAEPARAEPARAEPARAEPDRGPRPGAPRPDPAGRHSGPVPVVGPNGSRPDDGPATAPGPRVDDYADDYADGDYADGDYADGDDTDGDDPRDDLGDLHDDGSTVLWSAGAPPAPPTPPRGGAGTVTRTPDTAMPVVVPAPRTPNPDADLWADARPDEPAAEQGARAVAPVRSEPTTKRVKVVLSERRNGAHPVRTVVDIQEGGAVGELLRSNLIGSQLAVALRFAIGAGLTLGLLPLMFALFPVLGRTEVLGVRLPWLVLGFLVYPVLWAIGVWHTRTAERVEQNFADHVQD